jgi:hypothetical protein
MAYGTEANVGALARVWTTNGSWSATTLPTSTQVNSWLDQVSAIMDTALAGSGFTVPVTQATAVKAIASYVEQAVADLCHASNSSGRFFTDRALERGISPMAAIRKEINDWVVESAAGLEALGAARQTGQGSSVIGFREFDNSGSAVVPLFQRKDFGDTKMDSDA